VKYYSVKVGWGCLGLLAGSVIVASWAALNIIVAAAAVVAEVGSHAP
jgi:hypothetical protein